MAVDRTRYTFPNPDTKVGELIKRRRLNILVHSSMYYYLDTSIINDDQFDAWCFELVDLLKKYPNAYSDRFDYAFEDWDGMSGYDLPLRDPWVVGKAQYLIKLNEK
ncbi:MAG TPA: hypothetical protein DGP89_04110 [Saprospirales bacterium]|nr:hypothetical protein [Saprospirales bacterium]